MGDVAAAWLAQHRKSWHAVVTQQSWCEWYIKVTNGISEYGTSAWGTRGVAERVARRHVASMVRQDRRRSERFTVGLDDSPQDAQDEGVRRG